MIHLNETPNQMNHFQVDPKVYHSFPGMRLAIAVTEGLDNRTAQVPVSELWQQTWQNVTQLGVDDARVHPYVKAWRENFAALGVSMKRFPTSIEAMLRRALKGGEAFSINPLVDFYNALSLQYVCPAGALDLGVLEKPLVLRLTTGEDRFTALDSSESIAVPEGEIAYTSGTDILTRHFMWRQSQLALVTPDSTRIFMVSEIPGLAGEPVAEAMRESMVVGLRDLFGLECQSFLMTNDQPSIRWN